MTRQRVVLLENLQPPTLTVTERSSVLLYLQLSPLERLNLV